MNTKDISRRDFIQRLSLFGAAGVGASMLAACGGEKQADTPAADTPAADTLAEESVAEGFTCTDTEGLTEAELTMRNETFKYVDTSTEEGKTCDNCALYVAAAEGQQCGTCTIIKGPIHPNGYCISWAPKPA